MRRSFKNTLFATLCLTASSAFGADLILGRYDVAVGEVLDYPTYHGRVSVVDGRTLHFPKLGATVQLMDIDACELPQWSFDPNTREPLPCGGLAKAWLKRTVGSAEITCHVAAFSNTGETLAYCWNGKLDVALSMLRVGWARVATPYAQNPDYLSLQSIAMQARYGMWKDYVLDMEEWRRRAVDKTLSRRPIADINLLVSRQSEISPAFVDRANRPTRNDK